MVGKLLSLDLKDAGVVVGIVHPGFMRTEMTKGVGFDKYWDDGGGEFFPFVILGLGMGWIGRRELMVDIAVTPDEAAKSLIEWTEKLDISKTGQYWAPRGPRPSSLSFSKLGTDHLNRGYRHSRRNNRRRSPYTLTITLVDTQFIPFSKHGWRKKLNCLNFLHALHYLIIIYSQDIIRHSFDTKSGDRIRVSIRLKGIHSTTSIPCNANSSPPLFLISILVKGEITKQQPKPTCRPHLQYQQPNHSPQPSYSC
jgi:hypothetical protein